MGYWQGDSYFPSPDETPKISAQDLVGLWAGGGGSRNTSPMHSGMVSALNSIDPNWANNPQVMSAVESMLQSGRVTTDPATWQYGNWGGSGGGVSGMRDIISQTLQGVYPQLGTNNQWTGTIAAQNAAYNQQNAENDAQGMKGIPWQAAAMLAIMGAGAGGFLGAAGAPGGAAGGGLVGGGLEGTAIGAGASTAADLSAGWGVTQGAGGGMDLADLYSMGADGWTFGPGSYADSAWMYGPGNIGDVGVTGWNNAMQSLIGTGTPMGTSWLDYLKQGSSVAKALGIGGGDGSGLTNGGLLGALLGGALGSINGSKQAGTITTTEEPWAAQQPYLMGGFAGAANQLAQTKPSAVTGPAEQGLLSTIRGDYLNANPYLDATYQKAAAQVLPGIEGYFTRAGRTGSNSAANALSDASTKLATDIYGQNYARERGYQTQAITAAPQFATQMTASQYAPLANYMNLVGGRSYGGQQTQPYFNNQLGSILSGAATGYGLSRYL